MTSTLTRCLEPRATCECGYHRWMRVPVCTRAAIHVRRWLSDTVRFRLFWMLPPDSRLFRIDEMAQRVWKETRSLPRRMRLLAGKRTERRFACDLPVFQFATDGHSLLNLRTFACTKGIEAMHARYPGATIFDERMYREGWNRAEEWVRYTAGIAGRERVRAYESLTDPSEISDECDRIVEFAFAMGDAA